MRLALFIRSLMLVVGMLVLSTASFAQISVGLSVNLAPPELPVYEQPICPEDGDIWTPGYWAYGDDGYFYVPGDWVMAPEVGFLWTPGYWGWGGNDFRFHEGYWGSEVGFYGGVNYGFGYGGFGYEGGRWDNGHFAYNRSVNNINVSISRNTYNTTVVNRSESRVSFNGGTGGISVRATAQQEAVANQRHVAPVAAQTEHVQTARANPELRNSANHGKPPAEAVAKTQSSRAAAEARTTPAAAAEKTERPAAEAPRANTEAARPAAEAARPAAETARPAVEAARPTPVVHAKDIQSPQHVAAAPSGNAKQDQKYAQQQQKMENQQAQERQKLQTKQDSDHQRQAQQKASAAQTQQLEQRHAQQTQQLSQKHTQQQQQMQQRAPAPQHQAAAPRAEGKKP